MTEQELVLKYMNNTKDCGGAGRAFETAVRAKILGVVERTHPQGVADIHVRTALNRLMNLECKSGCPWLVHPKWDTKEDAEAELEDFKMSKADYVCYITKFTGDNLDDAFILTQYSFLRILRTYGIVRVKRDKNTDRWGIVIQSYIPSPSFSASKSRYANILAEFEKHGISIDEWCAKKGVV